MKARENFHKQIKEKELIVVGEYINATTKIEVKCQQNHSFFVDPYQVAWCDICKKLSQTEIVKKELDEKNLILLSEYKSRKDDVLVQCKFGHDPFTLKLDYISHCKKCCKEGSLAFLQLLCDNKGWKIIGPYFDKDTPIKIQCNNGHIRYYTPCKFKAGGQPCQVCIGKFSSVSEQTFYNKVKDLGGKVVGEYVNTHEKVECECAYGHTCLIVPKQLIHQDRFCGQCYEKTPENAFNKLKAVVDSHGGKILGEYVRNNIPIEIECENGHVWKPRPLHIISDITHSWCPKCLEDKYKQSKEKFEQIAHEKGGTIIIGYVNANTRVTLQCTNKHPPWSTTATHILKGTWCPKCSGSKGEKIITECLNQFGVEFTCQFGCYINTNRQKRFDFFVPSYNLLIEFDGQQHFEDVEYFKSERGFDKRRERDLLKTKYAKDNGMSLLRIPYWDINNVQNIISDTLDKIEHNPHIVIEPPAEYFT